CHFSGSVTDDNLCGSTCGDKKYVVTGGVDVDVVNDEEGKNVDAVVNGGEDQEKDETGSTTTARMEILVDEQQEEKEVVVKRDTIDILQAFSAAYEVLEKKV
ncbi:hypothetical protein Tco_0882284, partial [Tanacetum coccineum]